MTDRWLGGSQGEESVSAVSGNGGWALLGALTAAGASNLAFHLAMSRTLSTTDYGALGALTALLTVALVPATAAQLSVTRAVVLRETPTWGLWPLTRRLTLMAAISIAGIALISPWLRVYLHLQSAWSGLLLAMVLIPTAPLVAARGLAMGRLRYRGVAAATLVGVAAKLAAGIVLVERGAGIDGALLAILLGETITVLVLWQVVRRDQRASPEPLCIRVGETAAAVSANSGLWLLAGVGVILARHYQPDDAGLFAAGWLIAGLAFFLPAAVATVAFPRFASGPDSQSWGVLMRAMAGTLVLGSAVAAVAVAFPSPLLELTVGEEYQGSTAVLPILAVTSVLVALVNTLVHYHLARGSARVHIPWLGAVGITVVSLAAHGSIETIAWLSAIGTACVLLVLVRPQGPRPARAPRRLGPDEQRSDEALGNGDLEFTIVVPYYNPGPAVTTTLQELQDTLEATGVTYEIIPVADGCTDGSDEHVEAMASDKLHPVRLPHNCGKGEALSVGLTRGRGRYLGFMDGDGDIDPAPWRSFLELTRLYEPHVVLGSKRHPMSEVQYPPLRRLYSICYQLLVRALFRLKVRDTQTGIKVIRRDVLADVLPYTLERRFTFDLELLVVARRFGYRRFFEAPVRIRHRFHSTISLSSVIRMLIDTLVVFHRLHIGRNYEPPQAARVTAHQPAITIPRVTVMAD